MAFEFVWRSDKDSVKSGTVSIAACIEIAFSIGLYWFIWYWFDTHIHLLSSLIAVPFLIFAPPFGSGSKSCLTNFLNSSKPSVIPISS